MRNAYKLLGLDEGYISSMAGYVQGVALTSALLRLMPSGSQFTIKPFIAAINRRNMSKCQQYILPIVKQRMKKIQQEPNWQGPEHFLSWFLERSKDGTLGTEDVAEDISVRLVVIAFAMLLANTICISSTLVNLAHSPATFMDAIRTETENEFSKNHGHDRCYLPIFRFRQAFMPRPILGYSRNQIIVSKHYLQLRFWG